jgi:hypothetical protein
MSRVNTYNISHLSTKVIMLRKEVSASAIKFKLSLTTTAYAITILNLQAWQNHPIAWNYKPLFEEDYNYWKKKKKHHGELIESLYEARTSARSLYSSRWGQNGKNKPSHKIDNK